MQGSPAEVSTNQNMNEFYRLKITHNSCITCESLARYPVSLVIHK